MLIPKQKILNKASKVIFNKPAHELNIHTRLWMVDYIEVMEWVANNNVVSMDGYLTTQDSNYKAKIMTREELVHY